MTERFKYNCPEISRMAIDKEVNEIFSDLKKKELFKDEKKLKLVNEKDTSFFFFLTEYMFDNFFDKGNLTDGNVLDIKHYVYDVLQRYVRAESWGMNDVLYSSDVAKVEELPPLQAFLTIKYVADNALFHVGVMYRNENNDFLRYSGKRLYLKLSETEISKIHKLNDSFAKLYEHFDNVTESIMYTMHLPYVRMIENINETDKF
jgi:hypothetical protein